VAAPDALIPLITLAHDAVDPLFLQIGKGTRDRFTISSTMWSLFSSAAVNLSLDEISAARVGSR
jgi:hypothetical protein